MFTKLRVDRTLKFHVRTGEKPLTLEVFHCCRFMFQTSFLLNYQMWKGKRRKKIVHKDYTRTKEKAILTSYERLFFL